MSLFGLVFVFTLLSNLVDVQSQAVNKPNIVFFLTDDQDLTLQGMKLMTKTNKLIVDQGLTFANGFVSSPICCVSRSSIISGRYVHNHYTYNNSYSGGCSNDTWQTEIEPNSFAPYIQAAGYETFYAGKYLNQYGSSRAGGVAHIPPGWSQWFGLVGNSRYYNYKISANGVEVDHGSNYSTDYYTDIIHGQGIAFLNNLTATQNTKPFLMVLATPAAHAAFTPAPQYVNVSAGVDSPRTPNWNNIQTSVNKHLLMQQTPFMNNTIVNQSDQIWRWRHGTLQSVDDMIADVYNTISVMGRLSDTYFIYLSDHGFHLGQFGMGFDKRQLYENDIRVPFYISGPNIPNGVYTDMIALNIDIAPTLVALATGNINNGTPADMDGKSLTDIIFDTRYHYKTEDERAVTLAASIEQQFYIEYYGEADNQFALEMCGNGINGYSDQLCDSWNNTYSCVRMINGTQGLVNGTIYCKFKCYGESHIEIGCDVETAQGYGEYYNLDVDYYELDNQMLALNESQTQLYDAFMSKFLDCHGADCNVLREGPLS